MSDDHLQKLIARARRGRPAEAHEPPPGFTTRVAAHAVTPEAPGMMFLLERAARWGCAAALVACVMTALLHHRVPQDYLAFAEFAGANEPAENLW